MLTSILGLRSPLASIITPTSLTLTLLPSDSDTDKSHTNPEPSSTQAPPSPASAQNEPSPGALATISLLTGTAGLAATAAAQSLIGYLLLLSLFGPGGARTYTTEFLRADVSPLTTQQIATRAAMARDPRYAALFLPLFCAGCVALPEELLKYLPAAWVLRRRRRQTQGQGDGKRDRGADKSAAVRAASAAALGFGLVELAAYAHASASVPTGPGLTITLLERVFIALPGHFATAALSASRGADADAGGESPHTSGWRAVLKAVAPSVAYHALFDLVLLGSSAVVGGHVGWVHPEGARAVVGTLGVCVFMQGVLYVHTARAWLGWGVEGTEKGKEKGE